MKKLLIFIIVLISFSEYAYSQFYVQNYITPAVKYLKHNDGRLYLANKAFIMKSNNLGETWKNISVENKPIKNISIVDSITGFAVVENIDWFTVYELHRTTNGGTSWYKMNNTIKNAIGFQFINATTGWYSYDNYTYKTTNAGINWNEVMHLSANITSLYMIDDQKIFVTSDSSIIRTQNGGLNWISINLGYPLRNIKFINSNFGYCFSGGYNSKLFKTTNGGLNWTELDYSSFIQYGTIDMYFLNESTGWLSVSNSIYKTTNGGMEWFGGSAGTSSHVTNIIFANDNTGFAGTANGEFIKSTNSGATWYKLSDSFKGNNRGVSFINNYTGYIVNDAGKIYKTTNKGINWVLNYSCTSRLQAVATDSSGLIYVVGENGIFIRSSDFGDNWQQRYLADTVLYAVKFVNHNTGIICGQYGTIFRTENAGINWTKISSPTGVNFTGISFANDSTGWISGGNGRVMKTTNSGLNWEVCYIFPNNEQNYGIHFINSYTGHIINYLLANYPSPYSYSRSYITSNGGSNWVLNYQYPILYQYQSIPQMTSISISKQLRGYITLGGGEILITTNGLNWGNFGRYYLNSNYASCINNNGDSWIVGDNGLVLSTVNTLVNITKQENVIPEKITLLENYPNPFNPFTTIKFEIPNTSKVKITLFDISGREIDIITNQVFTAGSYKVQWDGSSYPSGVYFCKMTTEKYSNTIKLVLIK